MKYYLIVSWSFVVLVVVCLFLIFLVLNKALKDKHHPARINIITITALAIGCWIGILAVLSLSGFLRDFSTVPPRIFIVLAIPLLVLILIFRYGKISNILAAVPPQWLIYIQSFRVFVEILLWMLFLDNLLPIQMTLEGRNFDIVVGLTAINIGVLCFAKQRLNRRLAIIWNFIGLALLLNIVIIAILSFPTPFRIFMNVPANTIVTQFPIVLLPGVLVPIAYYMHVFSLKQLMGRFTNRG